MSEHRGSDSTTMAREDLNSVYGAVVDRLRQVGGAATAERFEARRRELDQYRTTVRREDVGPMDREPACVAIVAAVDRVDLFRAAVLDRHHARRWLATHQDQAKVVRTALALCGRGDVTG